ncbi:serpentine type 7TM GPCR chemoreceptor srsx domain-containing protein [Ditylenchus destructor]|nr:serpentine type 7TM GPCR chemoreceptor srsx domain-containing protein [Ditylenchus destructor]
MSHNDNLQNPFYEKYRDAGVSLPLVSVLGVRYLIALTGVIFNMNLVYVTVRNRSLRGSCNLLLAINAFSTALFQFTYHYPIILALTGINFIPLLPCFYMQIFSIIGVNMMITVNVLIGFDRLLCVLFPTWYASRKTTSYLIIVNLPCLIYSFYMTYLCYDVAMKHPNYMVVCSTIDCYSIEINELYYRNSVSLNVAVLIIYCFVWLCIWRRSSRIHMTDEFLTSVQRDHRIFKSLTAIMSFVFFGWFINCLMRVVFSYVKIDSVTLWYVSSMGSALANITAASNAPVLYIFSEEYRKVFRSQFLSIRSKICGKYDRTEVTTVSRVPSDTGTDRRSR